MTKVHKVLLASTSVALALSIVAPTAAYASETVTCLWDISRNEYRNIKGGKYSDTERVGDRDARRILNSGPKIRPDGRSRCKIQNAAYARLGVRIEKRELKLKRHGRTPDCRDLRVRQRCYKDNHRDDHRHDRRDDHGNVHGDRR